MGSTRERGTVVALLVLALALATGGCGGGTGTGTARPTGLTVSVLPDSASATADESPTGSESPSAAPSRTPAASRTPATAAAGLPASLRGHEITVVPTSRKVVALTFDAGANGDGLASILSTLSAQGVPGTFFLTGSFAKNYPAGVRSIVAAGHRLGNHTLTHPYCTDLSDAAIRQQIADAEAAIRAAGGSDTHPLFRFPYGDRDSRTIGVVNGVGYAAIGWTVDSLGWKGTSGGMSATTVADRVVGAARAGEIVLMHVGSNPDDHTTLDATALPTIISRLRGAGYGFVTLSALL